MNNIGKKIDITKITEKINKIEKIIEVIPLLKIFVLLVIGITLSSYISQTIIPVILSTLFALLATANTPLRQPALYLSLITLGLSLPYLQKEDILPLNVEYKSSFIVRDTTQRAEIFQVEDKKSKERFLLILEKGSYPFEQGDTIGATVLISELRLAHYQTQKLATIEDINYTANLIDYQYLSKLKGEYTIKNGLFKRVNNWCEGRLKNLSLKNDDFSIINGILLGNKRGISKETKSRYSNLGISHILAISGMHILILYFILNLIFSFANRIFIGRVIVSAIIISTLIVYTLIVGSPISAVRATIMFSLLQISNLRPYGRYQNINTIFTAATLIILYDYQSLTDVGFILSFVAVISILIYFPLINSLITKKNFLTNIVVFSLSAQILTTPIVLYYFGYISTLSILSNLIMTFIAPVIIAISIIHIIAPNHLTDWLIIQILDKLNILFDQIIALPYSHINEIVFSGVDVAILYFIIGMFTYTFFSSTKSDI